MLNEIFRLFGTIAVNNSDANKHIEQTGQKASKLHKTMTTAFDKIGKASAACGKAVATGLAVGAAAMGTLVVKSMNLAGELEQNMGGAEAVFKHCAQRMQNEAANAFKTMGLSQSDYLASANKMGSIMQGMGFSVSESADMTADAMQRAADVSSIMGISQEEAMEAIAGMAKKNFTMMDNLGVSMNDTALAAYALEKGMKKSYASMTDQEKIALAFEMFMDKTQDYAGNFAKETETLAGSLSVAKAAWQNFLSGSDTVHSQKAMAEMVDAFVNVGEVVTKNLTKLLPRLTKGLSTLIQRLTPYVPELLQALLPGLIDGAVALTTGLALALPDILEVLTEQLPYILDSFIASLDQILPALVVAITALFSSLIDNLPAILQKVGEVISKVWGNGVWPLIQNLFRAVFGVELPSWDDIVASISAGWAQIEESIRDWFRTTFGIELPTWEEVISAIGTWWGNIMSTIGNAFTVLFGLNFTDKDKDGIPWYERIALWFGDVLYALGNVLLAVFGLDIPKVEKMAAAIQSWWNDVTKDLDLVAVFRLIGSIFEIKTTDHGELYDENGNLRDTTVTPFMREMYTDEQLREMGYDVDGSHASGLDFVPRDGYRAQLHYGEAVLTRSEANAWRHGQGGGIDYDRLAEAMAERPLAFNIDSRTFAVMLAREMNRAIGNRNIQTMMAMGG